MKDDGLVGKGVERLRVVRRILKLGVLLVTRTLPRVLAAIDTGTELAPLHLLDEVLNVIVDDNVLVRKLENKQLERAGNLQPKSYLQSPFRTATPHLDRLPNISVLQHSSSLCYRCASLERGELARYTLRGLSGANSR